jgi:hypothetical protein
MLDYLLEINGLQQELKRTYQKDMATLDHYIEKDKRLTLLEQNLRKFGLTEEVLHLVNSNDELSRILDFNIGNLPVDVREKQQLTESIIEVIGRVKEQHKADVISHTDNLTTSIKGLFGKLFQTNSYLKSELEKVAKYYNNPESTLNLDAALTGTYPTYHAGMYINTYYAFADMLDFVNVLYASHPIQDWNKILRAADKLSQNGYFEIVTFPKGVEDLFDLTFTRYTVSPPNNRTLVDALLDTPKYYPAIGNMLKAMINNTISLEKFIKEADIFQARESMAARTEYLYQLIKYKYHIIFYLLKFYTDSTPLLARSFIQLLNTLPKKK